MYKKISSVALIILSFIFCKTGYSQSPIRNVGNITKTDVNGQQITIKTENAYASIRVYSPSVIRIQVDIKPLKEIISYAVISQPEKTNINLTNNANEILIETDSLKVVVGKKPFSVLFYNKKMN
jgi:alpha-glucosidase